VDGILSRVWGPAHAGLGLPGVWGPGGGGLGPAPADGGHPVRSGVRRGAGPRPRGPGERRWLGRGAGDARRGPSGRGAGGAGGGPSGRGAGGAGRGPSGRGAGDAGRGPSGRCAGDAGRGPSGRGAGDARRGPSGRCAGGAPTGRGAGNAGRGHAERPRPVWTGGAGRASGPDVLGARCALDATGRGRDAHSPTVGRGAWVVGGRRAVHGSAVLGRGFFQRGVARVFYPMSGVSQLGWRRAGVLRCVWLSGPNPSKKSGTTRSDPLSRMRAPRAFDPGVLWQLRDAVPPLTPNSRRSTGPACCPTDTVSA
jgi:hypothetical protein